VTRQSEDWPILGYSSDPVPGDPGVVRSYAAQYADVADAIGRASDRLRAIASKQDSESEFVSKFRDQATDVAGKIAKAQTRYSGVSNAMTGYAGPLEDAQTRADAALRQAQAAFQSQQSNNTLVTKYRDELTYNTGLTDEEKQHYTQLLHHSQQAVTEGSQGLTQAKAALQAAIDSRDAAANHATGLIQTAENTGNINDNAWEQFWDENGAWIDTAVTILGYVAAVALIVLMFIPGVNAIVFTIITIVVAAIVIANAAAQWSAGTKSPGEAILEIGLALIPFAGAAAAKSAVKLAVTTAAKTGMARAAANGISGVTKTVATDAVEDSLTKGPLQLTGKNVLKAVFTNAPKEMDDLQTIAKVGLRPAEVVADNLWKIRMFAGPAPEAAGEYVVHQIADPILDKLSGKND
jgi:hypothetical protein